MNESNTKRLFAQFPNLYCDKDQPGSVTRMCDGLACGDGWFDIIWKLSERLEKMIVEYKRNHKEDPKPPRASQVKEKFGALCFYMSHYPEGMYDEITNLINEAQVKSHKTCEKCGRPGKLRNERRWIRTLCEEHNKNP